MEKLKRLNSEELEALLTAKKSGRIAPSQNDRLGVYAANFANMILKTPRVRRFLFVSDPNGKFDLAYTIRTEILIRIMGVCPVNYNKEKGRAYSYCVHVANSCASRVMRDFGYRRKLSERIKTVYVNVEKSLKHGKEDRHNSIRDSRACG